MPLPFDLRGLNREFLFYDPDMDVNVHKSGTSTPTKANHLCVLVHGLWGNSQHLNYIAQSLRAKYDEDELIILACKRNASSFTYDGIEIGGERVAKEIEETVDELQAKDGYKITKFSIVGYSLGGLIARYAIGLLDQKGYFEHIRPTNFTTFASPHLGVRTPLIGYPNRLWNILGARTLSASGRQLFTVDEFRDTGRPLLSVLADPDSIFIHALARFDRRALYTNIVNDRSAVHYTTGISRIDPYVKLDRLKLNYVKGYEPVILDPEQPYEIKQDAAPLSTSEKILAFGKDFLRKGPITIALVILIPIGIAAFLINSGIQNYRSQRRILLHESDESGGFGIYRKIPYMVREVRAGLEDVFETTNASQRPEYLPDASEEAVIGTGSRRSSMRQDKVEVDASSAEKDINKVQVTSPHADRYKGFPTLALTTGQFEMIQSLDDVGITKYPVYIHNSSHSHAAMIVRSSRAAFDEGKVVIKHWLDEEFQI